MEVEIGEEEKAIYIGELVGDKPTIINWINNFEFGG
jgi:hypothetical protein